MAFRPHTLNLESDADYMLFVFFLSSTIKWTNFLPTLTLN